MPPKRDCRQCRRRKVKCDGLPTCNNCHVANTLCQYSTPKKRGPKPVISRDNHPREHLGSSSPADISPLIVNSPSLPEVTGTPLCPVANTPLFNGISANPVLTRPAIQTQAAIRGHLDLLTGLLVATPSDEAVSIANHYILLYTKFVFGATPIWHEATLRATVKRFFISVSAKELHTNGFAQVDALRNLTLLLSLCAAVAYAVPESLILSKHLTALLFSRASRDILNTYQDYDLEHPNSSSLGIRLFLLSAIQISTGSYILSEEGLIEMRMRLYDKRSLDVKDPIKETLLQVTFCLWAIASHLSQVMEWDSQGTPEIVTSVQARPESTTELSQAYFEMITLTNNFPSFHLFDILQRQWTSYLITLHSVKVLVLDSAIRCNRAEIIGLSADPLILAMRR
ncbi:hypothetical protein QL093DRAFT_2569505 [Fusarium oxysporum]|nr:hypothetical protein QL093DRAFT_2569505 [Fusarium oxysporum]